MKQHLEDLLNTAIAKLSADGMLGDGQVPAVPVARSRDAEHGDFASPVALALAKLAKRRPREVAESIVSRLPSSENIDRVEIAGPGFINFFLTRSAYQRVVADVLAAGDHFGHSDVGAGQQVQVEYVSANPTGPLHVGHGRGAAYGSAVAALLTAVGYSVEREYYVNDAGRQMDILATSVWLRYLELCGEAVSFPDNAYQGDYIWDIAASAHREQGDAYRDAPPPPTSERPPSEDDDERRLDADIAYAKNVLGEKRFTAVLDLALETMLQSIRTDLDSLGAHFDNWYSERAMVASGAVTQALERLRRADTVYERGGAQWFRSTDFGDEKDRVLVRDNGQATYFASDVAYHLGKIERGYGQVIDVWGADHHGYVPRVKAALTALGHVDSGLEVRLVQFASLYRGKEKVQMSTRSGEFVTLRELRQEVGSDAARFFYLLRRSEQHLDFDLELAKSQSSDNPVYYVQYAHARVCSVLRQAEARGFGWDGTLRDGALERLETPHEVALLRRLARYPEVIEAAATAREPHQVAFFLRELAGEFHAYYNSDTFLVDDALLRNARLAMAVATGQVIRNGLGLLGVSAPESM